MRSETPKLLHPICGRPMIGWAVAAAGEAGAGKVVVVEGPGRELEPVLDGRVEFAIQERPLGTGDAVKAAASQIEPDQTVIVLYGDVPLITAETIRGLADAHARSGAAATITTAVLDDPSGYGRVVRAPDGTVDRIVETKAPGDASELEHHIREVNVGIYRLISDRERISVEPGPTETRLVLPMINEATRCLEAGIVRTPAQVDLGMVLGTGFPPFRGGLLRHADSLGIPAVVQGL